MDIARRSGLLPFECSDPFHILELDNCSAQMKVVCVVDTPYFQVELRLECPRTAVLETLLHWVPSTTLS